MSNGSPSAGRAIVTLRSLPAPTRIEAAPGQLEATAEIDPIERALLLSRYRAIRDRLERETTAVGDDVIVTAPDPEVSRLQSRLASMALDGDPLGPGGTEVKFGSGFEGRDWFGWLKSMLDWVDRTEAHAFLWSNAPPETVGDTFQVAMTGDWGTNLYGAPKIAQRIAATGPFDLLLHLGDVYYSGTPDEIKERFLGPWPFAAGRLHRAINSNHEMYSGGYGYFDLVLPRFQQPASYFALQNTHWLLVGLDTAYIDHDMDPRQVAWLEALAAGRGQRKLVLFSHQQLFSRLGSQGDKLVAKLQQLLTTRQITAWYWGHEHQCVLYDRHANWGLIARCLGNGGIPEPRVREVKNAPVERTVGPITWRRLEADAQNKPLSPRCLVLDGRNPDVKGREDDFVPHSYMTLRFEGPNVIERVVLPDGTVIFENVFG
jgi:hypothetical protein